MCSYYAETKSVPPLGTVLRIDHRERIFAVDTSGRLVGALPTKFNYLADCIAAGFVYEGRVRHAMVTPVTSIDVDVAPHQ